MNAFKDKAAFYVTAVMIIICSIAVFIAAKVTVTAVKSQEQEVRNIPPELIEAPNTVKSVNTNKLNEQRIIFNGKELKEISAFYTDKKEVLLPLDLVLKKVGVKISYFASDDILEAVLNNKKLVVRLGKDSFSYGGKEISLPFAPVTAKGHVLVPAQLFSHIDGFSISNMLQENVTFLNFYNDFMVLNTFNAMLLKVKEGNGSVWSFLGNKSAWDRKGDYGEEEYFDAANDRSKYLLKSDKKVYILNPEKSPEPYPIEANYWCSWSEDSKYLYWEDQNRKDMYIYNVGQNLVKRLENNLWRAENLEGYEGFSTGSRELVEFVESGSYRRVSLKNTTLNKIYTIIQKNGRIIAEGNIRFSPNKGKMVYTGNDGHIKLSNQDGTGVVDLGKAINTKWISDNLLKLDDGYETFLYDVKNDSKIVADSEWKMLGQALDDSVFYTDGSYIYAETDGTGSKIISFPWSCDYVTAASAEGPYIIVSKYQDKIFYSDNGLLTEIGKYSDMLRGSLYTDSNIDLRKSILISPDKDKLMVVQKENGMLKLKFPAYDPAMGEEIIIDYRTIDVPVKDNIEIDWVSKNKILLYTEKDIWLIDMLNGVRTYKYTETNGYRIEGIITP